MFLFTSSLKWDIFIIYIIISLIVVISCLVIVSCLFLNYPAHDLTRSTVRIHENPMMKRTSFVRSNPNLCFAPNPSDGLLCVDNDIFRSVSCNNIDFSKENTVISKLEETQFIYESKFFKGL